MSKEIAVPEGMRIAANDAWACERGGTWTRNERALEAVIRYQQEHPPQFTDEQIEKLWDKNSTVNGLFPTLRGFLTAAFREAYSVPEPEYPEELRPQGKSRTGGEMNSEHDPVNHPKHYTVHPSGVECITVTEHFNFNVGNAIKYLWRSVHKNGLEDLKKAAWYVNREIARLRSH